MKQEKELTGYPSIDKPWLKYYSEDAKNALLPAMRSFLTKGITIKLQPYYG